jgi:hypothetical protein
MIDPIIKNDKTVLNLKWFLIKLYGGWHFKALPNPNPIVENDEHATTVSQLLSAFPDMKSNYDFANYKEESGKTVIVVRNAKIAEFLNSINYDGERGFLPDHKVDRILP